jgi:hypothetical protein
MTAYSISILALPMADGLPMARYTLHLSGIPQKALALGTPVEERTSEVLCQISRCELWRF